MTAWDQQAEFVARAVDVVGPGLWLVELGAGRQIKASIAPCWRVAFERLAPGDYVRIRFRTGTKTPRILGFSLVDRDGNAVASS